MQTKIFKHFLPLLIFFSCTSKREYLTQQEIEQDTISTSLEPMADFSKDKTDSVHGYWRKINRGSDSIYIKGYKRRPKR